MEIGISVFKTLKNCIDKKNDYSGEFSWQEASDIITGYQNNDHQYANYIGLCYREYKPGTFTIGEISEECKFLEKPVSFNQWITIAINDEIDLIKKLYPQYYDPSIFQDLVQKILLILNYQNENCCPLKDNIYYQEYPDILRRLILVLTIKKPDQELDTYPYLKQDRLKFIISVINYLDQQNYKLTDWLHFSIAAGMLGIDEKSVHAATSVINTHMAIRLPSATNFSEEEVIRVSKEIVDIARSKCRIDATRHFFQTLEGNQLSDFGMISLPDDYLETIFLLKYYEKLLKRYPKLTIVCIPKSKICGNDATSNDIQKLLENFPYLKNTRRFQLISDGPTIGGCNLKKMSKTVLDIIKKSQLIDVRGARNYEMLQGLNKDVYFGFIVCREISESLTGLLAESIPFIYLHQSEGMKSFHGFKERYKRIENDKMFALKTVNDEKLKWE